MTLFVGLQERWQRYGNTRIDAAVLIRIMVQRGWNGVCHHFSRVLMA